MAQRYRQLVTQTALFGAVRINNHQFLTIYSEARKTMRNNIPGAWRGAGLIPFNPDKILDRYRPVTPPFISFTDHRGRRADIPVSGEMATRIDNIVEELIRVCNTPLKKDVVQFKDSYLTLQADNLTLNALNQELVKKRFEGRRKTSKKHFGEARILTVQDIRRKAADRVAKETEEQQAKARRAALRGVVGFAKKVWKEMPVDSTIFD